MSAAGNTLERFGLNDRVSAQFADALEGFTTCDELRLGRIIRLDRGYPLVVTEAGERRAQAATELIKTADSLGVIGDWVVMRDDPAHEMGVIEKVLPRHGTLMRKDPGEQTSAQTIAANIDVVFVVQSLSGRGVNVRRLERELIMAYESGATPVIVLTKADLAHDVAEQIKRAQSAAPSVDVCAVSQADPDEMKQILEALPKGKTGVLIGESGVGKSTLINALVGEEVLGTGEVREHDDRGRHTTVAREMIVLPDGGIIVDSPGIRSISLWVDGEGIDEVFSEISSRASQCKFRDCTHNNEPQCAVKAALEAGDIAQERYDAYQELMDELATFQKKREDKARFEKEATVQFNKKQKRKYGRDDHNY